MYKRSEVGYQDQSDGKLEESRKTINLTFPWMMVEYTCGIPPTPLTESTSWIYKPVLLMIKGSPHSAHFLDLIGFIFWFFERTNFLVGEGM
jgi:hypothetical protein